MRGFRRFKESFLRQSGQALLKALHVIVFSLSNRLSSRSEREMGQIWRAMRWEHRRLTSENGGHSQRAQPDCCFLDIPLLLSVLKVKASLVCCCEQEKYKNELWSEARSGSERR
jgi:hypothetical protein